METQADVISNALLAIFGWFVYFLPTLFALERRHAKKASIFVINLFLGWTLIGWVISLSWAFSQNNRLKTSST